MAIKAENVLNFQRDRALKFHRGCDNHTTMLTIVTNRFTISLGRELVNQCELVSDLYNLNGTYIFIVCSSIVTLCIIQFIVFRLHAFMQKVFHYYATIL